MNRTRSAEGEAPLGLTEAPRNPGRFTHHLIHRVILPTNPPEAHEAPELDAQLTLSAACGRGGD
jgi:hypothetical protein